MFAVVSLCNIISFFTVIHIAVPGHVENTLRWPLGSEPINTAPLTCLYLIGTRPFEHLSLITH